MNNSSELLLLSLKEYFSDEDNINTMLSIVEGTSRISLRLIDWFITNHCKNAKSSMVNKDIQDIYHNYRAQLKAYKKIKFDPFRRRQRIMFQYSDSSDKFLNTTIGQLNFFKWAIDNNIIRYISERFDELENAMNSHQKSLKETRDISKDAKAAHLTNNCDSDIGILATKTVKISIKESFVYFD
tara:strand:- start:952 stop:1503 length:552 start_codon:yes stop_codon:yes gene_type:complete